MPFTSTQISGLVGGQQVMFANQAALANQIGGMGGGQQGPMMANPYPSPSYGVAGLDPAAPDFGTKVAGGFGMALPGVAAAGSMAASMIGFKSPWGLLDPFTGVSRAFGAGTFGAGSMAARTATMAGMESTILGSKGGMGLYTAWSNISGAFAQGGARAGLGAIGGGMAAGAVAAVPYYVAGKALEYGAENLYQGTQNVQDVRRMASQYMEPQYGQPGARLGGRMGAGQVKEMTSFMHELGAEDVQTSMKEMRSLMDRSGQMGMLQGIGDISQFKQRFKEIVRQTRGIAQILGTTLDEALPVTQKLQQMGMWTARDIIGTAGAIKAAGPGGAGAMIGAMDQGAQMSHAMGGRLESGARLGQELFTQVSAATRAGVFSQQDIRNITGGVGGAEGQRMMAGSMQQVFAGFGDTAAGRLMQAGLGEFKNGAFTGQMDEGAMAKWKSGALSYQDLQQKGQSRINQSKEAATSFFNKTEQLGQEMAQKGGMEGMGQAVQQAMITAGVAGQGENIENRFIQLITGSNQRQADMIQRMIKELPRIQAEGDRKARASLEDSFRQMDERRNKSLAGLGDAVKAALHQGVGRPLQELGESLTTSMSEATEKTSDWMAGRTRAMPRLGVEQQFMLGQARAEGGGPTSWADLGVKDIGHSALNPGMMENVIGRTREQGFGGNFIAGVGAGAALGSYLMPGAGTVIGGLAGGAAVALGLGEDDNPRMRALRAAGLGAGASAEDVSRVQRRAYLRAADPSMGGLFGGESDKKRAALETVKARMREIYTDPKTANELEQLKKKDPKAHSDRLAVLMGGDQKTRDAMGVLEEAIPGGKKGSMDAKHDIFATAQAELGYSGDMAVDYNKTLTNLGLSTGTPEEIAKFRQEAVQDMTTAAGGVNLGDLAANVLGGAALASAFTSGLGMIPGGIAGGMAYMLTRSGMTDADIQAATSSTRFSTADILDYATGKPKKGNRFAEALAAGDDSVAKKIKATLDSSSTSDREAFLTGLKKVGGVDSLRSHQERTGRAKDLAQAQGAIGSISGISEGVTSQLEKARQAMASGDVAGGERILSQVAGSQNLGEQEINKLLTGGGGFGGTQAGRLAAIGSLGSKTEMSREDYTKFMDRLSMSGADYKNAPGLQKRVDEMLSTASGGKIDRNEIRELQATLKALTPSALGQGKGGTQRSPAEEAQMKYIAANERFVWAVGEVLRGKTFHAAQDVKGADPHGVAAPATT